ncbi:MAG: glucosaminidase domain-containing protein [Bacteroidales bacterium]|nr:glucosaminidase domain-containing protein [Bacteroidales bacterium]
MWKDILVAFLIICPLFSANAQIKPEEYIEQYAPTAVSEMLSSGIPASITMAQACLESSFGTSYLSTEGNNHFGIKCHNWSGASIYKNDDGIRDCFRKYDSPISSFRDHSDFLRYGDRYASLFDLAADDYKGWAYGLSKAGYATDPKYAVRLIELIERYNLQRFDQMVDATALPPSPTIIEHPEKAVVAKGTPLYKIALEREILSINGVRYIVANGYETYSELAREYGLFKKELLRFNDLKNEMPIPAGTIIYLEAKKKKAAKLLDRHVMEKGETLYSISQRYAIKLKYLYKYNDIPAGTEPIPGSIINLKKL